MFHTIILGGGKSKELLSDRTYLTNRLGNTLEIHRAYTRTCQHGREDEVIPWTNDGDIEFVSIDILHKGGRTPSGAQDDKIFLGTSWRLIMR